MTKLSKVAVAVALVAAGCGDIGLVGVSEKAAPAGDDPVASAGEALTVDLRMRAVGTQDFSELLLLADEVEVRANGVRLPVLFVADAVDLSKMAHAAKIATFTVAKDVENVEIIVRLSPAGTWTGLNGTGLVDARHTSLRFETSVANLAGKNKAVLEIDAAKSFVFSDAKTLALVPNFAVKY